MMRSLRHCCILVLLMVTMGSVASAADKGATVTLNLKDADINSLITTVSEVTGLNFIVDPRVKGTVTVVSSSPMQADALYQTFLSVLAVQGFAAVPSGDVVKIVPDANVRQLGASGPAGAHAAGDGIVTRVFALRTASAAQLVPILRPLVPQWGQLAAYAPGNMLIVADRADNVKRLAGIIAELDTGNDEGIQIVPLQHAAASDLAEVLTTLGASAKQNDPSARTPAVIADTRTNSIVIAGDKNARARLVAVIQELDTPAQGSQGATQVIYLKYADAGNLAPILQGYAQQATGHEGAPGATGTATTKPGATAAALAAGRAGEVTVLPDKDTNALIVTAPPKTMQMIRQVISQLDIRRAQVQVEAIIAEVSATKASQLGIDWGVFNKNVGAAAGILNPNTLGTLATATGGTSQGQAPSTTAVLANLVTQGATIGGGVFGGPTQFAVLLHALKSDGDTNILSTPNITTLDNEEAKIEVGQEVPFLTGSFANSGVTSTTGVVNPFQTIDRKDVGLSLGITPTINQGDTIRLKIKLEDSSLTSSSATGTSALTQITNKRAITDTVTVSSGQILVIGGLIGDQINQTQDGVPLLSDIPLLGGLFRYENNSRQRQNLMVFIHPVILRTAGDVDYYSRMKYDHMREAQMRSTPRHTPLIGNEHPLLYEWDDYLAQHNRPAPPSGEGGGVPAPSASTAGTEATAAVGTDLGQP
ncbi:MAG TPA: type II secretion system secretin GspD [Nevskiaceae bacterium]